MQESTNDILQKDIDEAFDELPSCDRTEETTDDEYYIDEPTDVDESDEDNKKQIDIETLD
jgi:hypothetical protein